MLQFYKVFSLIIRVFTKPMVTYTKQYHLARKEFSHQRLRTFFVYLGNKYYLLDKMLNLNSINIPNTEMQKIKHLPEDSALEKGVEFFYEVLMYLILISLPLYEMYHSNNENKKKNEKIKEKLETLEGEVDDISKLINKHSENIETKINDMKEIISNYGKKIVMINDKFNEDVEKNRYILKKSFSETKELVIQIMDVKSKYENTIENIGIQNEELISKFNNNK